MMPLDEFRGAIAEISRDLELSEVEITVEQCGQWFHVLASAAEFRDESQGQRENTIWRGFERKLDDQTILSISQCYLLTSEELNVTMPLTAS